MRYTFATRHECDGCGAVADTGPFKPSELRRDPLPEGWGLPDGWRLDHMSGEVITDLCPDCLTLPMAELIQACIDRSIVRAQANARA